MNNAYVGTASGLPGSSIRSDSITYDERGKVRWAGNFGEEMTNGYAAMGALSRAQSQTPWSTQRMLVDPLGNIQRDSSTTRGADTPGTQTTVRFPMYSGDGTGRLRATHTFDPSRNSVSGPYSESTLTALDTTIYDGAGNRVRYNSSAEIRRDEVGPGVTESLRLNEATRYYYDAVGQLRATDRRRCIARPIGGRYQCVGWEPAPGRDPGVYEEYRYDALGRRVMVGTRPQENQCQAGNDVCTASLVTTVWDGDQLLVENRATAYSADWVAYTHGGGIDAPLAVRARVNALGASSVRDFIPLSNWRGLYDAAVFADGSTVQDGFDLTQIEWPAKNYRAYFDYVAPENTRPQVWVGSLMTHKRDASGQLYMRNRYFDPASGRFTQEDPIGIAGGLNLYAFGGGDPVSYTDPYGLSAEECCDRLGWEGDPKNVERAVQYSQNASRGERTLAAGLMGFAVGFLLPPVGAGALVTLSRAAPIVGGAGAAGSRTAARMSRPPLPEGMTNAQFGHLLGWGRGSEAARGQISKLSASTLREAGVNRSMAQAWQKFYEYEAQAVRSNPSAPGRADLMRHVADLLKD
ncbi:MAG TPA: DUF4951 domain-containing protein [Longimicrobium sp.]|nr:DUF4951 domain-containing protein [Longimicrobium sp.]